MGKFFGIIKKDVMLYFDSVGSLIFYIVLPILFTVILSFATGSFADSSISLAYADQANSPLSKQLLEILDENENLVLQNMAADQAQKEFKEGRREVYLLIPSDFNNESLISGKLKVEFYQQPNNQNSRMIYQQLQMALGKLSSMQTKLEAVGQVYSQLKPQADISEIENLKGKLQSEIQLKLLNDPSRLHESSLTSEDEITYDAGTSSSAGQLITWVFISLLGLSSTMAFDRERGTLKRLLASPTSRLTYFSATIVGQVLISLVQVTLLMIFGALFLKAPWLDRPGITYLLLIAFCLASAGLGALLGSLVRNSAQASSLSSTLGMLFSLLAGAWFPIEFFPSLMQKAANIFPTYWAMEGLKDILIRRVPFAEVLPHIAILFAFALLFLGLSLLLFKKE